MPLPSLPKYLKQDELTQDTKTLIFSLPTEKGWVASHLHQYQGFWHTSRQMQGVLACQNHFQANDSDILLITTPKSGTTWLKAISFAIIKRVHYSSNVHHPLLTKNPHDLVPFLELKLYLENPFPDFSNFASPRLFSSHLPLLSLPKSVKVSSCKIVYLCRNPKDTFVSLWHFTNKLKVMGNGGEENSIEEMFDKFCNGVSLYGPFWDHVLGYWKESLERPENVFFLKFEEIKEQPCFYLRKLAEFLGFPFSEEEEKLGVVEEILKLCSFDSLSNLEVNISGRLTSGEENKAFFRRGEVGDWMNYLSCEMIERFDRITKEKFHGHGLMF